MPMRMMHIRNVRVSVLHPDVTMDVGMRFACRIIRTMLVLMMLVMNMCMTMNEWSMFMRMNMLLGQM